MTSVGTPTSELTVTSMLAVLSFPFLDCDGRDDEETHVPRKGNHTHARETEVDTVVVAEVRQAAKTRGLHHRQGEETRAEKTRVPRILHHARDLDRGRGEDTGRGETQVEPVVHVHVRLQTKKE